MTSVTSKDEAQQRLNTILCRLPYKLLLHETESGYVQLCAFIKEGDGSTSHPTVGVWRCRQEALCFIQENSLENVDDKTVWPTVWKAYFHDDQCG